MSKSDFEGLSLSYRIGWRIRYVMYHLYGPAAGDGPSDPHWRLREERRRRVEAARAARAAG